MLGPSWCRLDYNTSVFEVAVPHLLGSKRLSVALEEVPRDDGADDGQALPRLQLAGKRQQARRLDVGVLIQFQ